MNDIRTDLGLRLVINAAGTMTALGASIAVPQAIDAASAILGQFVEIGELQKLASRTISDVCDTEAGFVTASSAAGLTLAVAGTMTGIDLGAVERLPDTSAFSKSQVLIQSGHLINYGAPIEQSIRLAGASVVPVGQATTARRYHLESAITERTAAAVYVVSHHTVQYGLIELAEFVEVSHAHGVPVIVDAASEYDLKSFLAAGADICLYSAHKFMGGLTAGIVAGRVVPVRHAYAQNIGIGRGMKVGKESIYGAIAAMRAWARRDHAPDRARQESHLALWARVLAERPGVRAEILPDPTGNPLRRLRVFVSPDTARITAWDLADSLSTGERPIIVRDDEIDEGYFDLDPCNLQEEEEHVVASRLGETLDAALKANLPRHTPVSDRHNRTAMALSHWPD
ncbi:aminotransferase class V-fold PLP-dependent enzyme [Variovorax sp. 770b2]|uniref:aminotransferase class V-fold PLP-dependent enzyme n=1 Tax=Variovorax sp. 770b2 TaxID=1566271 RepID=UPI0008F3E3A3|nr:aminotransferase class V-fold PLP-dependent enzyme [Variovorax sp. 770b2]SFQ33857.1 L-seryl-tRNA(Ser) seleniumtransferase [Variovorax sp. 770b2]